MKYQVYNISSIHNSNIYKNDIRTMDESQLESMPSVLCLKEVLVGEEYRLQKEETNEIIEFYDIPKTYWLISIKFLVCCEPMRYDKLAGYKKNLVEYIPHVFFLNELLANNYKLYITSKCSDNILFINYNDYSYFSIQEFITNSVKDLNYIICSYDKSPDYIGENDDLQHKFNIKEMPTHSEFRFYVFKHRENFVKCATH